MHRNDVSARQANLVSGVQLHHSHKMNVEVTIREVVSVDMVASTTTQENAKSSVLNRVPICADTVT